MLVESYSHLEVLIASLIMCTKPTSIVHSFGFGSSIVHSSQVLYMAYKFCTWLTSFVHSLQELYLHSLQVLYIHCSLQGLYIVF